MKMYRVVTLDRLTDKTFTYYVNAEVAREATLRVIHGISNKRLKGDTVYEVSPFDCIGGSEDEVLQYDDGVIVKV